MIKCNACGQENEEGVRTCVYCGTPMDSETQSQYSIESPEINDTKKKKQKSQKSGASIGLIIVSVLIPLVGIILFFKNKSSDYDAAKKYIIAAIASIVICSILFAASGSILSKFIDSAPEDVVPEQTTEEVTKEIEIDKDQPVIGLITTKDKSISIDDIDITVTENEFVEVDKVYQPNSNSNVLKVTVTYTNNKAESWWIGDIVCTADDFECNLNPLSNNTDTKPLADSTIKPGDTLTGVYYYNIPKNAKSIQLKFNSIFDASQTAIVLK